MPVTGDFAKLDKWEKFFEALASDSFRADVARSSANEFRTLTAQGFEKQEDPYGNPWAPKKRPNGYKILYGPDALLRKFSVVMTAADEFKLESFADYFRPHQNGAKRVGTNWKLPQRRMLPDKGDITPKMKAAFIKVYRMRVQVLRSRML